jgi:hypothetical protein
MNLQVQSAVVRSLSTKIEDLLYTTIHIPADGAKFPVVHGIFYGFLPILLEAGQIKTKCQLLLVLDFFQKIFLDKLGPSQV